MIVLAHSPLILILQISWTDKMLTRVRNLVKADRRKNRESIDYPSSPKRQCEAATNRHHSVMQQGLLHDPDSIAQHKKAMSEEMSKAKPKESVVLSLMKMTYQNRYDFICNRAESVQEILEEYPAFQKLAIVGFFK